jgi:hypothetical protein
VREKSSPGKLGTADARVPGLVRVVWRAPGVFHVRSNASASRRTLSSQAARSDATKRVYLAMCLTLGLGRCVLCSGCMGRSTFLQCERMDVRHS